MIPPVATAAALGRKAKVAVLQPFLKHAAASKQRGSRGSEQDQPRASASYADACGKLDEAVALADTLGCEVVFKQVVPLRHVHPKYLFGSGKADEMSGVVSSVDADAVFVNAPLSGNQQKALSKKWDGTTILDRFRVILDIFADRARTTEAKLQVELATLKYEAAHLVQSGGANKGRDSGYDRQRGGLGAIGGSGEKALETRRRLLRDRTAEVNRQLKDVERRRGFQRGARNRRLEPTVALVGYTNVGKSSLLNQLALSRHSVGSFGGGGGGDEGGFGGRGHSRGGGGRGGGGAYGGKASGSGAGKGMVHARNRVFDTLDPTVRSATLPSRARCVLVDTVGFIQDLPTDLIHSFRATLEEVRRADLLLHVRDASVQSHVCEAHKEAVDDTLRELGAEGVPTLEVWNKVDKEFVLDVEAESSYSSDGEYSSDEGDLMSCGSGTDENGRGGDVSDLHSAATEAEGEPRDRAQGIDHDGDTEEGLHEERKVAVAVAKALDPDTGGMAIAPDHVNEENTAHIPPAASPMSKRSEASSTRRGPSSGGAIRVSAATGEGLGLLLERVDALLHLGGDNRRFAAKPLDRYQYVKVLPGQSRQ